MKTRNTIRILFLFLCVSIITSCKDKNADKINSLKSVIENTLNKKLKIPDSLGVYAPFPDCIANGSDMLNSEYQIYSRVDASCGTCIGDINSWNKLIPEFNRYKVPIILICSSDDDFELIKYFCETGAITDFGYPFFLDKNNEFVKNNKFMAIDKSFETVLTDQNRNILAIGSPVHSKGIKEIYFKEIQKRIEVQ